MSITVILIIVLLLLLIFGAVVFLFSKFVLPQIFSSTARTVLNNAQEDFLRLAKERFDGEFNKNTADMSARKQEIAVMMKQLDEKLERYEKMIRTFEDDRTKKYGALESSIRGSSEAVLRLQSTTDRLSEVLGNVKLRGQWGERIAEDILSYAGMQEHVHFEKNKAVTKAGTRPDFTFILPDNKRLNMDVKFPLARYLELYETDDERMRQKITVEFMRDVKNRIKEIQKREYIDPSGGTLPYVLLFIPNEQVYGFVHETDPQLIDDALQQKVVLCSPFSLYAVLSVIRESVKNFHFEAASHEIFSLTKDFISTYERFQKKFETLGDSIDKSSKIYDEINNTNFRMLNAKLRKIEGLKT